MADYLTALHSLPVPEQLPAGAGPDIPLDMKDLADAIDPKLTPYIHGNGTPAVTATAAGKPGRRYRDDLTGNIWLDIGAAWVLEGAAAVAGNGISVVGQTVAVDLAATPGLEFSAGKLRTAVDGTTLERSGGGALQAKDGGITAAKLAAALKPSAGAAAGTEALRALGIIAGTAAAGNDARIPTSTEKARLASISTFIATLLDDLDAAAARGTLGLGALAVLAAVGTAQITDGSVTPGKRSAAVQSSALGPGNMTTPGGVGEVNCLTAAMTGTGRPVLVIWSLVANNANSGFNRSAGAKMRLDGATIIGQARTVDLPLVPGESARHQISGSGIITPSAGAHNYGMYVNSSGAGAVEFNEGEISVVEL